MKWSPRAYPINVIPICSAICTDKLLGEVREIVAYLQVVEAAYNNVYALDVLIKEAVGEPEVGYWRRSSVTTSGRMVAAGNGPAPKAVSPGWPTPRRFSRSCRR